MKLVQLNILVFWMILDCGGAVSVQRVDAKGLLTFFLIGGIIGEEQMTI
jgi:hypothetical protein